MRFPPTNTPRSSPPPSIAEPSATSTPPPPSSAPWKAARHATNQSRNSPPSSPPWNPNPPPDGRLPSATPACTNPPCAKSAGYGGFSLPMLPANGCKSKASPHLPLQPSNPLNPAAGTPSDHQKGSFLTIGRAGRRSLPRRDPVGGLNSIENGWNPSAGMGKVHA